MRERFAIAAGVGLALLAGSLRAAPPEAKTCTPRVGEKLGMHFVEVCPEGFFISATPVACTKCSSRERSI